MIPWIIDEGRTNEQTDERIGVAVMLGCKEALSCDYIGTWIGIWVGILLWRLIKLDIALYFKALGR